MDDEDIKVLFDRIAHHFAGADEGARGMFAMLVETTMRYRDLLAHAQGKPLTVGEASAALEIFMEVLRTQRIPAGLEDRVRGLVMLWLEELRKKIHH